MKMLEEVSDDHEKHSPGARRKPLPQEKIDAHWQRILKGIGENEANDKDLPGKSHEPGDGGIVSQ